MRRVVGGRVGERLPEHGARRRPAATRISVTGSGVVVGVVELVDGLVGEQAAVGVDPAGGQAAAAR